MQPAAIDELPELESRPQVLDYALLVWDKIPPVYFAPGSSVIPDEARASLRAAISLLGKSRQPVVLAGHTGNLGSSEYNRALGELRAQRVKQALVQGGIPGETISTVSFGPDKPASQGSDDRVEFGIPGPDMAVR
jgi:peptidoglycan-associated lipoprotein